MNHELMPLADQRPSSCQGLCVARVQRQGCEDVSAGDNANAFCLSIHDGDTVHLQRELHFSD